MAERKEPSALAAGERNYGIDLLRCVAMFMVLVLHLLLFSGTLTAHTAFSVNYETAWTMEAFAYGAVDIYALISGYVGAGRRVRYAGLANLWITVCFYTVLATAVFAVREPAAYDMNPDSPFPPFVRAFFPVMSNQYWYFCAYFLLYLFLPLVNKGLEGLSLRRLQLTALLLFFACCAADIISYVDVLRIASGYSPMWLLTLYVIGAAVKRGDPLKKAPKWALALGYVVCAILTALSKYALGRLTMHTRGQVFRDDYLFSYNSPTVVLGAVFMLLLFSRLRLPKWLQVITGFFAPSAFSVYLIHENPLFREFIMKKHFVYLSNLAAPRLILEVIVCALGLYFLCTAFDLLRRGLFRLLKIKPRLAAAETKAEALARRWIAKRER